MSSNQAQTISSAVKRACRVQQGFKLIEKEAESLSKVLSDKVVIAIAEELLSHPKFQVRMLIAELLKGVAPRSKKALGLLKHQVSRDENWRVQEMLARAFDEYCSQVGYEYALKTIRSWLSDKHPNVRRAVTEGLRVWTKRDYFRTHPDVAVKILAARRRDESKYVRISVGNALRDISKQYPELVSSELEKWDRADPNIKQTFELAVGFLKGKHGRL